MHNHPYKSILLIVVVCFCFYTTSFGQPQEVRWLQNINPTQPNSDFWQKTSQSVYPLAVSIPTAMLLTGYIQKDAKLKKQGWNIVGALVVNTVIVQATKYVVKRQRPYEVYPNLIFPEDASEIGNSFPSGHTSTAFNLAASVSIQCKKWYIVVPAYTYASTVGYSRMYLGKHYPTDVFAGAAIGIGTAYLNNWLQKKIFK
ncbi:MAG: phosphatase PAP2 family protein [Chitinophagaceae bacterium]